MSHNNIREDKNCLNCNHIVEERYCPNCGQENTDTRKTFHHLFIHFFEDLTHYENAFWRTIKNLLFKPATLTKEYLSGKRMSYLAPVRLYIFISFVTFFLAAIIPAHNTEEVEKNVLTKIENDLKKNSSQQQIDSIIQSQKISPQEKEKIKKLVELQNDETNTKLSKTILGYSSVHELDSIQRVAKHEDKLGIFNYWVVKNLLIVQKKFTNEEIIEKGWESAKHNFPKVLLLYMPFFAFLLWLFHNKKRWFYFDHGIFTLHYFSFLLLISLILYILNTIFDYLPENTFLNYIIGITNFVGYLWMMYYFFPAHRRFYEETKTTSIIKGICLFFINMFFITILLLAFALFTLINLH